MPSLKYLGAIIPTTIVAYGLVVSVVLFFFFRQERRREQAETQTQDTQKAHTRSLLELYFSPVPFQYTYASVNAYGGNILLLCTRIASFCYIFGISGLWNFINNDWSDLFYFTLWNVLMISAYYAMAIAASIIGLVYGDAFVKQENAEHPTSGWFTTAAVGSEGAYWSAHVLRLSLFMQILFEVAGASAFFVTVVAFSVLNPDFVFWNVNVHFLTSMTFLLEMSQNSMIVRWHHVLLNMLWALIYLFYIWPAVATHKVTNWPYDFLDTSNAGCFAWYFVLFFADALFYMLLYYISRMKYEVIYKNSELAGNILPLHLRGTGNSTAAVHTDIESRQLGHHQLSSQNSPVRHPSKTEHNQSTQATDHIEM